MAGALSTLLLYNPPYKKLTILFFLQSSNTLLFSKWTLCGRVSTPLFENSNPSELYLFADSQSPKNSARCLNNRWPMGQAAQRLTWDWLQVKCHQIKNNNNDNKRKITPCLPVYRTFPWPSSPCRRFLFRGSPETRTGVSGCVCGGASSRLVFSRAPGIELSRRVCFRREKLPRRTACCRLTKDGQRVKHPCRPPAEVLSCVALLSEPGIKNAFPLCGAAGTLQVKVSI